MEKNKILCIHHNDSDGRLAGAIIKNKFNKAKLVEVSYNDYKEKLKFILKNKQKLYNQIYILDFSMEEKEMQHLIKLYDVIWCDHHKSAMKKLKNIWGNEKIKGLRSINKCGAKLTWEYFNGKKFKELELVDDYDRWIFKFGNKTHYFAEINKHWTIKKWMEVIRNIKNSDLNKNIIQGKKLYEIKVQRVKRIIETGKNIKFQNKKTLIVNNTNITDTSLLGNMICENGYKIAIIFSFNKNKIIFSLRSKNGIDVSKIAEKYGGGGHKNAAGFVLKIKQFKKFITEYIKE